MSTSESASPADRRRRARLILVGGPVLVVVLVGAVWLVIYALAS